MVSRSTVKTSSWGAALAELGLDHPALLRLGSTRDLLERGHRIHEQRRSLEVRLFELQAEFDRLTTELDTATNDGIAVLDAVQREVTSYTSDLSGISDRLRDRLAVPCDSEAPTSGDDSFVEHHRFAEQYENILDMFSSFGMFDARSRTVRFQGDRGRVHQVPTFDTLMAHLLTDELRGYLADARDVSMIITPAVDPRVFAAVGKTVGFTNYAGLGAGGPSEGEACADFVRRLRVGESAGALADDLVRTSPFDGLRVSLYAQYTADGNSDREILGQGLPIELTGDDITMQSEDAAQAGVQARPLSPPEYLMLQAVRRRHGDQMLDDDAVNDRSETWFPQQTLSGAPGTLVARSVQRGLRFRAVELGKGAEGRGYRMAYAPLAA